MILRIFFRILRSALWLALLVYSLNAQATTDAKAVQDAVQVFMTSYVNDLKSSGISRAEFTINAIDNRLAFPDCGAPLQIDNKNPQTNSNRLTLKVSCQQGSAWSIFVPVSISIYRNVVTALQPLQRGSVINTGDLQITEMDISNLHSQYYTSIDELKGKLVKRPIRDGTVVTADSIDEPILVHRGDMITIIATAGSLTVKMQGTALGDGRDGEQISVRNLSSERVIKAKVKGPGEVMAIM